MRESIDYLDRRAREPRLLEVTLALAAALLELAGWPDGRAARRAGARVAAPRPSASRAMVAALGGPADLLEAPDATSPPRR